MPVIIAHRGASSGAPENTAAAVRLAWEEGADAVEVDVRLTKDRRIVLMHDASARRTCGVDRPVSEMTFAEIRRLDAGRWKGEEWAGERAPSLEEVLGLVPRGRGIFVEIKCGLEILPVLCETLGASGLAAEQVTLIGFDAGVMKAARIALPDYRALWLVGFRQEKEGHWAPSPRGLPEMAKAIGVHGLNLKACPAVTRAFVAAVHRSGLLCCAWTVDDAEEARRLRAFGVDGITTNRPRFIREAVFTT